MNIGCRVGWHRWTVWGTPERVPVHRVVFSAFGVSSPVEDGDTIRIKQTRQCSNCGLVEQRWLKDPA